MADRDDRSEPVLPGTAATDYERYLRTDELLSLQKTAAEVVHRDEHLFQAVHQSSELWLKLACLELEAATASSTRTRPRRRRGSCGARSDAMLLITSQLGDARAHVAVRLRHRPHGAWPRRGLRLARLPARPQGLAAARRRLRTAAPTRAASPCSRSTSGVMSSTMSTSSPNR